MQQYEVLFNRQTWQEITIKVMAESLEEAEAKADEEIGVGLDHAWEVTDFLGGVVMVSSYLVEEENAS